MAGVLYLTEKLAAYSIILYITVRHNLAFRGERLILYDQITYIKKMVNSTVFAMMVE